MTQPEMEELDSQMEVSFCIISFDQIYSVGFTSHLYYFRKVILLFFLYRFICQLQKFKIVCICETCCI